MERGMLLDLIAMPDADNALFSQLQPVLASGSDGGKHTTFKLPPDEVCNQQLRESPASHARLFMA